MKKRFYSCPICGNFFGVINDSEVVPVCCGKPMQDVKANSTDAAGEKHVPVLDRNGKTLTVKVGSVPHPMTDEHLIRWILAVQGNKFQRMLLTSSDKPEATFTLDSESDPVTAYEYCNLHGLWMAEE